MVAMLSAIVVIGKNLKPGIDLIVARRRKI
jgi:hypothetical protein